jgi:HK97 family phage prohead protease
MSNTEKRAFESSIEIRMNEDGTESRTITGYGAVFNKWSSNLGWFREKMDRTAFDNVDMSGVIATFNHDFNNVLARADSDTLRLSVDDYGLRYEFEAPNTTAGNDLLENVRVGNVKGSSFMFTVADSGTEWRKGEDGMDERTIKQVERLIELGPVTVPAYPDTTVAKRDLESAKEAEKKEDMRSVTDTERKYKQLRAKI